MRFVHRIGFAVCLLLGPPSLAPDWCGFGSGVNTGFGSGCALAQTNEPVEVVFPDPPPKPPVQANQIEFFNVPGSGNKYWLDLESLALVENEIVRFSTVVVSESGVRNVRHEAFRCKQGERKLLAIGRSDGSWSVTSSSAWQPMRLGSNINLGYPELFRAMCFGGANVDRDRVVEKIRNGVKVGNF